MGKKESYPKSPESKTIRGASTGQGPVTEKDENFGSPLLFQSWDQHECWEGQMKFVIDFS